MSNITIGWNNSTPTDSDLVGQGDDVIRSVKSNVQGMLDAEHFFPSGGGAAGAHRRGSARVFVGTSSQVSSADTDGRLMWNTSTNQLNYLNSSSSVILGGAAVPHVVSRPSATTRYMAMDSGSTVIGLGGGAQINFALWPSATFAATPQVFLSLQQVENDGDRAVHSPFVSEVNTTWFTVYWGGVANNSTSTATLNWLALGERAYP